jgi:hypothetical protein
MRTTPSSFAIPSISTPLARKFFYPHKRPSRKFPCIGEEKKIFTKVRFQNLCRCKVSASKSPKHLKPAQTVKNQPLVDGKA